MNKAILSLLLLAAAGGAGYWYWQNRAAGDKTSYLTEPAVRGPIVRQVVATGVIDAVDLVSVGAQVSGQIKKLYVKLGQQVKKGDMVAEIDSVAQRNQYNADRAILAGRQADLAAKQAALRIAQTRFDRERALRKKNANSREDLESAENTLALAKAEVAQIQAQIRQSQLAIGTDEQNLGYTRITAPLDGTVVSVVVDEGQTVNANQTTPTIVQIADLSRMENNIEISEGDIGVVKEGMPLAFTVLSLTDKVFTAEITSLDPGHTTLSNGQYGKSSASASSSSSSSSNAVYFYGKAVLDNPEGLLRIGMTTENTITVAQVEDAIIVPITAVQGGRGGRGPSRVRVLNPAGEPEVREVRAGLSDGINVEIIEGLNEGEAVILGELTAAEIKAGGRGGPGGRGPRGPMMGRPPRR